MANFQTVGLKFYVNTAVSGGNWIFVSQTFHIVYNTYSNIQYPRSLDLPNATAHAGTKWRRVKVLFYSRSKGGDTATSVPNVKFDKYNYQVGSGTEYSMERIGYLALDGGESNA